MSPGELREARKGLNLTADEFGRVFGVTGRSISRYEAGDRSIPHALAVLVRLVGKFKVVRKELGLDISEDDVS